LRRSGGAVYLYSTAHKTQLTILQLEDFLPASLFPDLLTPSPLADLLTISSNFTTKLIINTMSPQYCKFIQLRVLVNQRLTLDPEPDFKRKSLNPDAQLVSGNVRKRTVVRTVRYLFRLNGVGCIGWSRREEERGTPPIASLPCWRNLPSEKSKTEPRLQRTSSSSGIGTHRKSGLRRPKTGHSGCQKPTGKNIRQKRNILYIYIYVALGFLRKL
jgi:hypothetical protein